MEKFWCDMCGIDLNGEHVSKKIRCIVTRFTKEDDESTEEDEYEDSQEYKESGYTAYVCRKCKNKIHLYFVETILKYKDNPKEKKEDKK